MKVNVNSTGGVTQSQVILVTELKIVSVWLESA